jgi:hypothetical protein
MSLRVAGAAARLGRVVAEQLLEWVRPEDLIASLEVRAASR